MAMALNKPYTILVTIVLLITMLLLALAVFLVSEDAQWGAFCGWVCGVGFGLNISREVYLSVPSIANSIKEIGLLKEFLWNHKLLSLMIFLDFILFIIACATANGEVVGGAIVGWIMGVCLGMSDSFDDFCHDNSSIHPEMSESTSTVVVKNTILVQSTVNTENRKAREASARIDRQSSQTDETTPKTDENEYNSESDPELPDIMLPKQKVQQDDSIVCSF